MILFGQEGIVIPPLTYLPSGTQQPRRAMILHWTAITPLTLCLSAGVRFIGQSLTSDFCLLTSDFCLS
jgi:hypothetical protein